MMTSNGAPYRHQELCLGTKEIDTPQEEIEAERFNKLLPHLHSGEGPDCIFFNSLIPYKSNLSWKIIHFSSQYNGGEDMEESVTDPDCGSRNLEPLSLISEDQEKRAFGYEHRQILSVKFSPHNPGSST